MSDYDIRLLIPDDDELLLRSAEDVFDELPRPDLVREFLADPRHHIAVALRDGRVVGFASGFHYVHPDKPATLFVNEVGVAEPHRRRGLARRLLEVLFRRGRQLGCGIARVGTEIENVPARRLYATSPRLKSENPCVFYEYDLAGGPTEAPPGR